MLKQFLVIFGAVLVIEGLPYMAQPAWVKRMMGQIHLVPDVWLHIAGSVAVITGLILVWFAGHI